MRKQEVSGGVRDQEAEQKQRNALRRATHLRVNVYCGVIMHLAFRIPSGSAIRANEEKAGENNCDVGGNNRDPGERVRRRAEQDRKHRAAQHERGDDRRPVAGLQ